MASLPTSPKKAVAALQLRDPLVASQGEQPMAGSDEGSLAVRFK
jgi:hypothetical protein